MLNRRPLELRPEIYSTRSTGVIEVIILREVTSLQMFQKDRVIDSIKSHRDDQQNLLEHTPSVWFLT